MLRRSLLLALVVALPGAATSWSDTPTAPGQPTTGPGGSQYPHAAFESLHLGSGDLEYWTYIPDQPRPKSAPVIAFLHGWSAMQPFVYQAWLTHLVRRGNIVIFPRYQASSRTSAGAFTPNAATAIKQALLSLRVGSAVRPNVARFALVGHSAGGVIGANLAAQARERGLPRPRAVMCVEPGRSLTHDADWGVPVADYSAIPAETLLLCLVGADDRLAGKQMAQNIMVGAQSVPAANKNLVIVHSDPHGAPPLVADHEFPASRLAGPRSLNALDYYACWKLLDALTDAAFLGRNREVALGNTPEQRFMGHWSDGVPVKELEVVLPL